MLFSEPSEVFRKYGMIPPDEIFFDEKIHRFSANGKPRDKAGWYTGKEAGELRVLVFGDWRTGEKHYWSNLNTTDERTTEFKEKKKILDDLRLKVEQEQQAAYEQQAQKASEIWKELSEAPADHPYLQKKGIGSHAVRLEEAKNLLVIPVMNEMQRLQTLQFIDVDGKKKFLKNGKVKGGLFWIGENFNAEAPKIVLICEGFATGATLHECTNHPVAVAFNLGNLKPVLQALLRRFDKQTQIVLCADDDRFKKENGGLKTAKLLAEEFGIRWVVPSWPEGSEKGTDFNDLSFQVTQEELRRQVESVLEQPAEIPSSWWKISESDSVTFSSQFAAESWTQSHPHCLYQHPDLWQFNGKVWERLPPEKAKSEIHRLVSRGKGAEEGMLKAAHIEDTFAQSKMLLQQSKPVKFDSNSMSLVFRNGTLDLAQGEFFENQFDPENYTTILREYDYDYDAECRRWKGFLEEVELEKDTIRRLQEWCGYCLIPDTNLQKCLMLVGDGKNGKSVFLQTLREVLGSANVSSLELAEMFDRFKVGTLQGKLANICSDVDTNTVIHTSFKKIVAGEHTVAERKHSDPFEFQPFARILFSANKFTPTRDHSEGFYRRFDIVRFQRHFEDHERDPELLLKLKEELAGIFNWSLEGLVRLTEQNWNLTQSESMSMEHKRFRIETHPVRGFLEECCEIGGESVEKNQFLNRYREWCECNSYRPQSTHRVTSDLGALGIKLTRARITGSGYRYEGISLL